MLAVYHLFFIFPGGSDVIRPLVMALALLCMATPAFAQPRSSVAPADEYFGRLKMSVLGIANVIRDMRLRVESDPSRTPSIFGGLANVEDAIRDWESKYPHDSWIPRNLLALETTYLEASGERAARLAAYTESWLSHDYGNTAYAAKAHAALAESASAPAAEARSFR